MDVINKNETDFLNNLLFLYDNKIAINNSYELSLIYYKFHNIIKENNVTITNSVIFYKGSKLFALTNYMFNTCDEIVNEIKLCKEVYVYSIYFKDNKYIVHGSFFK